MAKKKTVKKVKSTKQKIEAAIKKDRGESTQKIYNMIFLVEDRMHGMITDYIEDEMCIHELETNAKIAKSQMDALRVVINETLDY